jgi:8-oxo-dGTP diphosphatase
MQNFSVHEAYQAVCGIVDIYCPVKVRTMVEVVAALIWDGERFMICQRPKSKARAMLWEFVGGKVEPGETKEQALVRECREEIGVTVQPADVFDEVSYKYPDINIHMTLFNAKIAEGTPQMLEHNDIRWIKTDEIPDYDFCPADTSILEKLQTALSGTTYRRKI